MTRSFLAGVGIGCLVMAGAASAQVAISANSGMINYIEGKVLLDGKAIKSSLNSFSQLQNGSEIRTEEGRVEVLLGSGVFLRMGENSAVRMVSNDLMDTRVEFLGGSAIIESADMVKGEAVTFTSKEFTIGLLAKGLYRLDSAPLQLSVYSGEARVTVAGQIQVVRHGHRLQLEGVAVAEKFDTKEGDELYRWAERRAEYLSVANVSAARAAQSSPYLDPYQFLVGAGWNPWTFNPFFGTYTFMPLMGYYDSPWGIPFYSPQTVYLAYVPNPVRGFGPIIPVHVGGTARAITSAGSGFRSAARSNGGESGRSSGGFSSSSVSTSSGGFSSAGSGVSGNAAPAGGGAHR
jgi:uncharacterized membrane protein YgcG